MESLDISEKPGNGKGNWEVYKDDFAPPPPSRTIRAWERAPVPAHAPRLQGQKIWKRAGGKSQRGKEKENFDAAQTELEREGKGARKRLRRGVKENIGDATWKENILAISTNKDLKESEAAASAKSDSSTAVPLNDVDMNALQFIPRKRTNTNHVITPKKPLRQATLNSQAQTQALTTQSSPEKPVRRRKSMRKSIRKSVAEPIPDMSAAIVEDKSTIAVSNAEAFQPEVTPGDVTLLPEAQPIANESSDRSTLNDKLNKLFDLTDDERPTTKEPGQTLGYVAGQPSRPIQEPCLVVKIPLNDLEEVSQESSWQPQSRDFDGEEKHAKDVGADQLSRGRRPLEVQSAILESIETETDAARPTKTTNTPKKKRGPSQRRGTRRSTRTTRASSVRAEEEAASEIAGAQALPDEPSSLPTQIITQKAAAEHEAVLTTRKPANEFLAWPSEPGEQDETSVPEPSEIASEPERGFTSHDGPVQKACKEVDSETLERDVKKPEGSGAEETELDDFDITAQLTLQLTSSDTERSMVDEDFELLPVSLSTQDVSLNIPVGETKSGAIRGEKSPYLLPDSESLNTVEELETLESISVPTCSEDCLDENETLSPMIEDLPETSTPDPTTSELVEAISENALPTIYDHDDTDMLRNFLTRVKANKAAKAGTQIPKRKRSLPHSPLRLPLSEAGTNISPSPQKIKDESDVVLPGPSPSKRRRRNEPVDEDDTITDSKPTRRSGRTRLPVIKTPLGAPSHIPIRRLGQDDDTTVTLRRSEEKELAALTRVNTRKNKGASQSVPEVLAKKAEEREDPILRQRLLKELFDEKAQKGKKEKKVKTVIWAEELTQFQTVEGRNIDGDKEREKEAQRVAPAEEKKSAVKVGVRSKIALGMAANGTPAPKRKRARS